MSQASLPPPSRPSVAELRERVGDVPAFLVDIAKLLGRVARDPRVPLSAKLLAAGAAAYAVSPFDLIPDVLPVIGGADDIWLVGRALRHLVRSAGHDVVRELWPGSEDGFSVLLVLAGISR